MKIYHKLRQLFHYYIMQPWKSGSNMICPDCGVHMYKRRYGGQEKFYGCYNENCAFNKEEIYAADMMQIKFTMATSKNNRGKK